MNKIAAIQMNIESGNKEKNLNTAIYSIEKAIKSGVKIVCLPELFNTGYLPEEMHNFAEKPDGETITLLCSIARKHNVSILGGSIAIKEKGNLFNTSYIINHKGDISGVYHKTHLFPLMGEDRYFKHGNELSIARLESCLVGVMICYDIRFPELARVLALNGADILYIPAAFPNPRLNHWRILLQARAIENQLYVIAVNRVGSDKNITYFGHSMIVDPWGEILSEAGENEEIIYAEIESARIKKARDKIPCFHDRREDIYPIGAKVESPDY